MLVKLSARRLRASGVHHQQQRPHRNRHHRGARSGTDEHVSAKESKEIQAQRDVVLASTFHLDPSLLEPQWTDSAETAAARRELAEINARLPGVVATYEKARAAADGAAVRAEVATDELLKASAIASKAAARWEADRALLASYITEAYTTNQLGSLTMLFSADSDKDLVTAMMMLQEMSDDQSSAVQAAALSRDRMQAAAIAMAEANRRAQEEDARAKEALAKATAARQKVLVDLRTARKLLEDSVLADQLAAIQALSPAAAAAAAAAVARRFVAGNDGDISFPLPADASFRDQDNFGARSKHWKREHTGDDFSTSCGTPVLAVTDGTVIIHTDQTWSGRWLVIVSTGAGQLSTWYAHMAAILVVNGQPVRAGQPIGVVGAEGNATGCHLHLEVHPFGGTIYQDDADPRAWLHAVGVYPG